ncbi:fructose permease [Levilactobacillus bambusae]|uniref:Fructose permease n=1 Tax=Levilactobacillus bambusae TaxID=2024736 RepID=A0A2V1N052_9LACO|nr:fructose permease [Levilactobacillus bambusae]
MTHKVESVETNPGVGQRNISVGTSLTFFVLSLVINSAGNVLTLVTSAKIHPPFLGAAYWTAAENNFGVAVGWNLFWTFLIIGMGTTVLNAILVGHWSWRRALGNLCFMVPFSALIQIFQDFFMGNYPQLFSGFPEAHGAVMVTLYVGLNFLGVALIAIAISIYQRVNLVLHPADDLMQILRFKYFKGNAVWAMLASYIPPTILAIVAILITHTFTTFGVGTVFAFLAQGAITGWGDQHVFPWLKHQALDVGEKS